MSKQKHTIALDFDGVLHKYEGWQDGKIQGPIPGAREAVLRLMAKNDKVVVFSTRDGDMIRAWLTVHNFPPLEVTREKRPFWVIVDDRAFTFRGPWSDDVVEEIQNFRPYWMAEKRPLGRKTLDALIDAAMALDAPQGRVDKGESDVKTVAAKRVESKEDES